MDAFFDITQKNITGSVQLKLYKGNVFPYDLNSPYSLYNKEYATFEEEKLYDQKDAEGFINLFSLPGKIYGMVHRGVRND